MGLKQSEAQPTSFVGFVSRSGEPTAVLDIVMDLTEKMGDFRLFYLFFTFSSWGLAGAPAGR